MNIFTVSRPFQTIYRLSKLPFKASIHFLKILPSLNFSRFLRKCLLPGGRKNRLNRSPGEHKSTLFKIPQSREALIIRAYCFSITAMHSTCGSINGRYKFAKLKIRGMVRNPLPKHLIASAISIPLTTSLVIRI
jgi:hypothetical protein